MLKLDMSYNPSNLEAETGRLPKFEASLSYMVRSSPARATQQKKNCLKEPNHENEKDFLGKRTLHIIQQASHKHLLNE